MSPGPGVVGWAAPAAAAAGLAGAVWQALNRPRPLGWTARGARPARDPRRLVPGVAAGWLALSGWPLSGRTLRILAAGAAVAAGLASWALTQNPLVAGAMAVLGAFGPETVVRGRARRRWQALDQQAYAAAHVLRLALDRGTPVRDAWRALATRGAPVFTAWAQPLASGEATGDPLEGRLKAAAQAIAHVELAVLADILAAERTTGQAAPLLDPLLTWWGQRLEADARRRGMLAGTFLLSYGVLGGALALFWGLMLTSPAVRQGVHTGWGTVAVGVGAWLLAVAGWLQVRVSRQSEVV